MLKSFLRFLGLIDDEPIKKTIEFKDTKYFPKEYYIKKEANKIDALYGWRYFEELDEKAFKNNEKFLLNNQCPSCNEHINKEFEKSCKCPNCKKKIYKLKDFVSGIEGYYNDEQKELRSVLKKELSKRRKFFEIYDTLFEGDVYKLEKPLKTDDTKENMQNLIDVIYTAKPSYYKKSAKYNGFSQLRMCRFYLAEILDLLEQNQQAKEIWCQVLCLDLIDDLFLYKQNISELERLILDRNIINYSYNKLVKGTTLEQIKPLISDCTTILLHDINYKTTLNFNIIWDLLVKYDKHLQQTN